MWCNLLILNVGGLKTQYKDKCEIKQLSAYFPTGNCGCSSFNIQIFNKRSFLTSHGSFFLVFRISSELK